MRGRAAPWSAVWERQRAPSPLRVRVCADCGPPHIPGPPGLPSGKPRVSRVEAELRAWARVCVRLGWRRCLEGRAGRPRDKLQDHSPLLPLPSQLQAPQWPHPSIGYSHSFLPEAPRELKQGCRVWRKKGLTHNSQVIVFSATVMTSPSPSSPSLLQWRWWWEDLTPRRPLPSQSLGGSPQSPSPYPSSGSALSCGSHWHRPTSRHRGLQRLPPGPPSPVIATSPLPPEGFLPSFTLPTPGRFPTCLVWHLTFSFKVPL